MSVLGQVVYASEVKSGNKLSINLPEGSYVVCIKSSGKVSQQKLEIE
ncbi:MAG: T9SS type A sorting domain-containing protein [Bacteroidales bacterium]|nr:T9SS type A sorting domain-containing protein [Bacteroidales bacterium]